MGVPVGVAAAAGVVACWPVAEGAGDAVTLADGAAAGLAAGVGAAVDAGVAAGADGVAVPAVPYWYRLYSFISAMRFAP